MRPHLRLETNGLVYEEKQFVGYIVNGKFHLAGSYSGFFGDIVENKKKTLWDIAKKKKTTKVSPGPCIVIHFDGSRTNGWMGDDGQVRSGDGNGIKQSIWDIV